MNFFTTDQFRLSVCQKFFMFLSLNYIYLQYNLAESAALGKISENNTQPTEVCRSYCKTPSCLKDAAFFNSSINTLVNPCDDFYEFVCGNFKNNVNLSDSTNVVNMFALVQTQVSTELFNEIKKGINKTDLDTFKKIKTYYRNCLNESYVEKEGTKRLFDMLNVMGGWPVLFDDDWDDSKFDWTESIYKLRENAFPLSFPVQLAVFSDNKNSTKRILKVLDSGTIIDQSYFINGVNEKYIKYYYKFMTKIALALGAKKTNVDELKDMLAFEIDLFKSQMTTEEAQEKPTDNLMTIKELSQNYPTIPWLNLFNKMLQPSITIDENEVVSVIDPDYITKVEKLLLVTPKRVIANYLAWQVIHSLIPYMPAELRKIANDFRNALSGTTGGLNRESKCLSETIETFPIAVSSMYVKKYFNNPEIKKSIYELVQNIKSQTKRTLQEIDWMDEETRKAALHKLALMTVNPAYADELLSDEKINEYYENLEIKPGSYLESALNSTCFILDNIFSKLRKPVDKNDWTSHPNSVVVNAYYMFQINNIEIPAGILKGLFFKFDRPKYLNYGAIGSVIGHEITHGFDNNGRRYDEQGNFMNWWLPETEKRFLNKVQCIIDQYSNFTVKEVGMQVNGVLTQGENIADNGGFKAAYHAYNEWASRNNVYEDCLPSLNYSPRQMFWISAASTWCSKERPEYLQNLMATDVHSPNNARVIVSFSNMKEFAEDFKCNVGSRMNPEKKCVVW